MQTAENKERERLRRLREEKDLLYSATQSLTYPHLALLVSNTGHTLFSVNNPDPKLNRACKDKGAPTSMQCKGYVMDRRVQGLLPTLCDVTYTARLNTEDNKLGVLDFFKQIASTQHDKKFLLPFYIVPSERGENSYYELFCEHLVANNRVGRRQLKATINGRISERNEVYLVPPQFKDKFDVLRTVHPRLHSKNSHAPQGSDGGSAGGSEGVMYAVVVMHDAVPSQYVSAAPVIDDDLSALLAEDALVQKRLTDERDTGVKSRSQISKTDSTDVSRRSSSTTHEELDRDKGRVKETDRPAYLVRQRDMLASTDSLNAAHSSTQFSRPSSSSQRSQLSQDSTHRPDPVPTLLTLY